MQRAEWLRNEVLTAGVEWEENHFVLDRCDVSPLIGGPSRAGFLQHSGTEAL